MPVTFLRTPADYFGIQEAPVQPLFQQTRALADPAVQNQLGFMDKVTQLRQQRPLARAQAMQNEYDTIFANADRLRMQQEAAKQAEQAVSALAGLTPEADDYVAQRQEIQRQFPSAMLDPRVQRIVDDNDRVFGARQSSLARQQQELQQRRAKLFGAGATPQQVEATYQNPDAAAQLEYQLGKGGGGDKGNSAALKSAIDLLNDEIKAMSDAGEDYEVVGDQQVMKPAYKELLDRRSKYRDAYLSEVDTAVFPQAKKTATTAAPQPQAESQVVFKERMKGLAGGQATIPQVKDEEVIADLNSPDADENTFIAATTSPSTSLEVKRQALEKLRQFAKSPPKDASLTLAEATKRAARLRSLVENGEKLIRMQPEIKKINEAWTQEKDKVAKWINDYADSIGVYPEAVENSIRKGEFMEPDSTFNQQEQRQTVRDALATFIRSKEGIEKDPLKLKATKLEPFHKSEFAKEFGVKNDFFTNYTPTGILGSAITALGFLPSGEKTYGDVLDAYLAEKEPKGQQPQAAPEAQIDIFNVSAKEEVDALPKGSKFRGPDGKVRIKQ